MTAPLKVKYDKEVAPVLMKALSRKNKLSLPRLLKVNLNVGIGKLMTQGNKDFSHIEADLSSITGQKTNIRKARMSVSNFKLREGMPVGLSMTLRGRKMYDFVERLVRVALPRVRDFQGIGVKGFDGNGNFSIGLKDSTIFPEVNQDNLNKAHGLQINICTSAENDYEGYVLLKALGFPFKDEVKPNNE
jgi:large subunit ribosomal protein L5